MPTLTIDGKQIEFKQGQTIIEAARDHGIEIAHFCWHPALSVSGNCRMCLVEVEKLPKLVIACATLAAEGMIVYTQSERSVHARNAVMEFLLINHPLDCPICDEAGECKLQDYAYQHGTGESRFVEEKVHKDKRVPLGPRVMFDAERCISCSRCIRFCDEIAKEPELTFIKRGDRVTIVTFPGEELDNPYSMNTIDICPVGALTSRDFRFKARVWDMSANPSVCIGCSRGCNIDLWVRNNQILRITPRYNEQVNSFWMCDHGRLETFKFVNHESRIDGPHLRKEGILTSAGWDEAFSETVSRIKTFSKDEIAVIASPQLTCEDSFIVTKFTKSVLNSGNLDFTHHLDPGFADNILRQEDISPNTFGLKLTGLTPSRNGLNYEGIKKSIKEGKIKALFLIEEDLVRFENEWSSILTKLDLLVILASNFNQTTDFADLIFPAATYAEKNGTFVNHDGFIQRIRPAVATAEEDRALEGMAMSRLDKFGTRWDRWAQGKKYDARSTWKILANLSSAMGAKMKFNMAEDVFTAIAGSIPAFKNINYDDIGLKGIKIKTESVEKLSENV